MSKHWRPDEDIASARFECAKRERLPEGAAAGLLLVAAAALGMGIVLYQVMGPRDVVAAGAEKHLVELAQ